MKKEHKTQTYTFVGRTDALQEIQLALLRSTHTDEKMIIQSVEGSGGIGKSRLLDHALNNTDLKPLNYLTLRLNGNELGDHPTLDNAIYKLIEKASAPTLDKRPRGDSFPKVTKALSTIAKIRTAAIEELQKKHPNEKDVAIRFQWTLDSLLKLGKGINSVIPKTKDYVNCDAIQKGAKEGLPPETYESLMSLQLEKPGFLERLKIRRSVAERNAIKANAPQVLSDALMSDISSLLVGYQKKDFWQAGRGKLKGVKRLLLILDDYEHLEKTLGDFLLTYFLPALRVAHFETTVIIIGRDQLVSTSTAWDQHIKTSLLPPITLPHLSRTEMDQLVEASGVTDTSEKERAWRDTEGYPLNVELWIEEAKSGGRSALMLRRFYERQTRWMSDKEKFWLQHVQFLEAVNKRTLQKMLGNPEEATQALYWFEREGSVRDTLKHTYQVREYIRSRLIDYLNLVDPDRCEELRRQAEAASA